MTMRQYCRTRVVRVVAGLTGVCLSLTVAGTASAAANAVLVQAPSAPATLVVSASNYGQTQHPLYFQVVGAGFRPGEAVTVAASLILPSHDARQSIPLLPVHAFANQEGQVAATLDGGGFVGPSDGFMYPAGDASAGPRMSGITRTAPCLARRCWHSGCQGGSWH